MTEEPKLSRAEQKALTRRQLAQATRELIEERGFRGTTIEDITDAVGVSPRTFFRHFPSKEAALFSRAEDLVERLAATLDQRPVDEPPLAAVRAGMVEMASLMNQEGRWLIQAHRMADDVPGMHESLNLQVAYLMRQTVQAWAERRLGVPSVTDPRPGLLAGIAVACGETSRERWLAHAGTLDLAMLMEESFDSLSVLARSDRESVSG